MKESSLKPFRTFLPFDVHTEINCLLFFHYRFFTSEIIRAALFTNLGKELPYCCEVRIEDFKDPQPGDKREVTKIKAVICVERDSQKGIVVGKGGSKIKDVGVQARKQLEDFLQCSVHLDLNVRVEKDWRRDEKKLKEFGYL